jgi:pimeloyl-ACP methyl ester carboxylesterase
MPQPDRHVKLADGSEAGYAEAGDPDGYPVLHLHGTPGSRLEVCIPAARQAAEDLGIRLIGLDRPGIGLSTFRRFAIGAYPRMVRDFADALGLEQFAVTGVSGGGKYACACAWQLPDRITRAALVSSTCPVDLPGAKATVNKQGRLAYAVATRAPWLLRPMFAKLTHDVRRDPTALFSALPALGPADQQILADEDFRRAFARDLAEAFRQGDVARRWTTRSKPGPGACRSARSACPSRSGTAMMTAWCSRRRAGSWPTLSPLPPPTSCPGQATCSTPATMSKTSCTQC